MNSLLQAGKARARGYRIVENLIAMAYLVRGKLNFSGLQYSRFCELQAEWVGRLDRVLRQEHRAGEKVFVDYAGQTVPVVERSTGELPECTSGCSRTLEASPNPTYHELAVHYGTAALPTRVRRPRDKARVEAGVLVVERWVLARLRKQTFFSLGELNQEIRRLLDVLNTRPFQKLDGTRHSLFETLERPLLRPLPERPSEFARWKKARVNIDYHIEVEGHCYSVPHTLVRQRS